MAETKVIAASIVSFLKKQLDGPELSAEAKESLEVALQCLESAFELEETDHEQAVDLSNLVSKRCADADLERAQADNLKTQGNELMKQEKFHEALDRYSRAIAIDPRSAVYFCNRAAAHFKLGSHEAAAADCTAALALAPDYSKAHGRLGLALDALGRVRESRQAFARALQLEPDNESYRQNLHHADEKLAARGERPALDFGGLLQNPALLNMATEMLSDPNMQNLISGLMSNTAATDNGGTAANAGGMNALLEAGQALAQHMQTANPDLVEQLRRQVRPQGPTPPQ